MAEPRVSSFGRRKPEPEDTPAAILPPILLPPVRLQLELDRDALLTLGDQVRETVYAAATAGLQAAIEDFAGAAEDGDDQADGYDDGGPLPAGDTAPIYNGTGRDEPVIDPKAL